MRIFTHLALLLILSACATSKPTESEQPVLISVEVDHQQQVREAYSAYKAAILADQGAEAVQHVDSRTVQYYTDIQRQAVEADSLTVDGLAILDKLMVLAIRHRTPREQLLSFDGVSLFTYAVEQGMVGKNSVANLSIGTITINGDTAQGQVINNGQVTPLAYHFNKEDGRWKIDLTSIFGVSGSAFQQMVDQSEQAENDYLLMILELTTGKKPGADIWQPVK